MSSLVIKQLPLLEVLTKVNDKSRKKILKYCDQKLVEAIAECVYNILRDNVQISQQRVNKLKKYKKTLRDLANPQTKLNKKHNIIVQSGGSFLPLVLKPIVSYLLDNIIP